MYLSELQLNHYRNYESVDVHFSPDTNVLIGENAQGKTNLLEAIYVLALARSHRTNTDRELIQWHEDFAKITGLVQRSAGKTPLELVLSQKGKKAKVNHLEQAKLSQYIGQLNVVLFAPEDLNIVKGSPAVRRHFIDMEFGQMSSKYLYNISQYKSILKQRNQYLKQLQRRQAKDLVYLGVLSDQLAAYGAEVTVARRQFLQQMEKWAQKLHQEITKDREVLTFKYQSQIPEEQLDQSVEELYQQFQTLYEKQQTREVEQGTTLIGPHRDDVQFLVNDKDVQAFGSQGQQRTTALSVKLAEIDLMKAQTGEYPILLLDDVLSELDDLRQTHLLKTFQNKVQTFLTTTSLENVKKEIIATPRVFTVTNGVVTEEQAE
ncbi:DNA replication/repair protein RecF [Latilactobacillus sakei]|jgi:DNA replication and repair protein RecF|uniref:DNA replication and repair protein RecF n=1 Tax=Latilactobacillus sakei TaxID=1599 RepID=A0A094YVM6_LATSK|nr:DNA replication/repair protein RecF [Latilactobacillus sakei]ARJ72039.1 DNA replication and repair protein RecF [Latilactobacillus sakei]AST84416.1 DNA replication and repair protein RecF [Latilactobacillus sakei]AWZ42364.1 DNA replication and repair protein RecF [Latilactobacillus sakei]AWZ45083.1 DNA replication and repair protein RecF [Latilactobacillus sakei]AWZ46466.1 DNA replication and repair protein RecF [Latilactobacillus sakei]